MEFTLKFYTASAWKLSFAVATLVSALAFHVAGVFIALSFLPAILIALVARDTYVVFHPLKEAQQRLRKVIALLDIAHTNKGSKVTLRTPQLTIQLRPLGPFSTITFSPQTTDQIQYITTTILKYQGTAGQ